MIAFDYEHYLTIQKREILKRIKLFDNKLYLEFGGKLIEDNHAARVLPGFHPSGKLEIFSSLKEQIEVIIVVNTNDIVANKIGSDNNISYQGEVERLIDEFRTKDIAVCGVVFSFFSESIVTNAFIKKLARNNIKTYKHYVIEDYPHNLEKIFSEDGLGRNEYVETTRPLVVVTAPGSGSGKLATCLSQLYHDNKNGIRAGYAKYETFPIWNLPLNHPLNLAYEAATVDLGDFNVIDPYYLDKFNVKATNYNRDVDAFPVLKAIFEKMYGETPYESPTMMGVNMVGFALGDEEAITAACKEEVIRRFYSAQKNLFLDKYTASSLDKIRMIMNKLGIVETDRKCVLPALKKADETHVPCMALVLNDGKIITAKTSKLLSPAAALFLNSVKYLANINDEIPLISPNLIEPIEALKKEISAINDSVLNLNDTLISLAIQAPMNPLSDLALKQIEKLKGAQAHSSVLLDKRDRQVLKQLGINVTEESVPASNKLYCWS
ncbi:MAG: hypothetical protein BWX57_00492 [Tenericutes bacterium ADurb.Bin024]|nr:MAG: hypothetical protein BWX57_00492 [Tenericutes bacterium ADurb.Bin024]